AIEDSAFLFFPRQAFIGLIKKDPSLVLNMLALLSERLRKFARIIEDLSLKEVPSRLAAYILYHSQMKGLDYLTLDISKNQLASLLGTIPETFSRILTKMKNEGIIEPDGRNNIRVLDKSRLEHLANGESRLT
ncbi:MAG: Crp/Fnr family transcriptional regulator, partial [bacterium]